MPFQPGQSCQLGIRNRVGVGSVFGLKLAEKWFGYSESDVEKIAGRFTKGRNVGQVRGWLVWVTCKRGGWHYGLGGVIKPGMVFAHFCRTWDEVSRCLNCPDVEYFQGVKRVDTTGGYDWRVEAQRVKDEMEARETERAKAAETTMEKVMEEALTPESLAKIPSWQLLNGLRTAYLTFRMMKERAEGGEKGLEQAMAACRVMKRKFREEADNRGLDGVDDATDLSKTWVELTAPVC